MVQAHIFYSGMVQGVGFRYTVQRMAKDLSLLGRVRNLKDGRVEILVQGEKDTIEELMERIKNHFSGYIKDKEISFTPLEEKFMDFQIIF